MSKPTDERVALYKKIITEQEHALKCNSPRTQAQLDDLCAALQPLIDGKDA